MADFISWNCRGCRNKRDDIRTLLSEQNPICFALQETHLKSHDNLKIRGYNCIRKDFTSDFATGGVALLISRNFPHSSISLSTDIQALAIQINIKQQLITLCTIYLPPNSTFSKDELNNLIEQLPEPFILLGDFNAHNPLWGSKNRNFHGKEIEKLINENDLCLFNDREYTYFHEPSRSFHTIDLILCSPSIFSHYNFSVCDDLYNSDHFPLFLTSQNSEPSYQQPRYIYEKANWSYYMKKAIITEEMTKGNIDEAVVKITQCIIDAADASIPKTHPYTRKNRKPWWNEECTNAKKQQQKAWGIFRRYPTTANLISFKQARADARRIRRKSQRESWTSYVSSIDSNTSSKELWKKAKRAMGMYNENFISFLKQNGQTITSPKNIANTIARNLSLISNSNAYPDTFLNYKTDAENNRLEFTSSLDLDYNSPLTETELHNSLKNTQLSAPGPDNITYPMLKHLSRNSLKNLLSFYNRIWNEQTFPVSWYNAIVIPFPKPGKDPSNPQNYRPIALTSCMCKLLEKIINTRLIHVLETKNKLPPWQSGFRYGRSAIDNILALETQIRNAFIKRNHLVSIFFDMEKAYDKTWRYGILRDVFNFGLRGNLPIFLQNFLKLRQFQVRIGDILSDFYVQEEGVPQGSVLSVTLFSIKINDILKQLPCSVHGTLYVDDLHVSCQGQDMRIIQQELQLAVTKLTNWAELNGFKISTDKTSCVHFCHKRNLHPDPEIFIKNSKISVVDNARFLGVTFDRKLTFLSHILNLRTKCMRTLNLLRVLSNTRWGADRDAMLKIYRALIRSKLDYGCEIYGSARPSVLRNLDTVHHTALRICLGAFRTSPIASLYVLSGEPSLYLTREELSLKLYYRILSHPNHPLHRYLLNDNFDRLYSNKPSCIPNFRVRINKLINNTAFRDIRPLPRISYNIPPWKIPNILCIKPFKNFQKHDTSTIVFQQLFAAHRSDFSHYSEIFTDGSKSKNRVGCAFVCRDNTYSYKLPSIYSIFSAELLAVEKALSHISTHRQKYFIIYTDSQSVIDALIFHSPASMNALSQYQRLTNQGYKICFCWVPGHVGINGNELADNAAKQALYPLRCATPLSDIKKTIKTLIRKKWQESWDNEISNKLHSIKTHISIWPASKNRKNDVIINRLRIGHSRLTHKYLILNEPSPVCGHCQRAPLSVRHILSECPALFRIYRKYFGTSGPDIKNIVGMSPHPALFDFLRHCGFYNNI